MPVVKKVIPSPDKVVFNASEACGYLDICWKYLKDFVDNGEIQVRRIGRRYIFTRGACDDFLNQDRLRAKNLLQSLRQK